MTIETTSNHSDDTDRLSHEAQKWRDQCLQLIDELATHEAHEALLRRMILRLTAAAKGLNPRLDPSLKQIGRAIKERLSDQILERQLNELGEIVRADEGRTDTSLLFSYLHFQMGATDFNDGLVAIQAQFEAGKFANEGQFFSAIEKVGEPASQFPAKDSTSSTAICAEGLIKKVKQLFDQIEIPTEFSGQIVSIKERLQTDLSAERLQDLLEEASLLLMKIKRLNQEEQQQIESFLSQVTQRISELGETALNVHSNAQDSVSSNRILNQTVFEKMRELQEDSLKATKLETLKELIDSQLNNTVEQLKALQGKEDSALEKSRHKLGELTQHIKQMELESHDLKNRLRQAHHKALRDPLTGLANRLAYDERIIVEYARWRRYKNPLILMIWDIDLFKRINDQFGHKAGDKALTIIAQILSDNSRQTDFIARFGGEEFIMLLPNTEAEGALFMANKLRGTVENASFNSHGETIKISLSCGISEFSEDDTADTVFERADKALYMAKQQGRNRCLFFPEQR